MEIYYSSLSLKHLPLISAYATHGVLPRVTGDIGSNCVGLAAAECGNGHSSQSRGLTDRSSPSTIPEFVFPNI
ncbi:hypothetical protein VNO77_29234 [Canavalia gladiata]|uniref:Uncharacterized protein n=1 Tax=Canavalia gladiata TaxID=3824 RepID=A0AAN9L174_CANGL